MSGTDDRRHRALVALGSNIEPETCLPRAVDLLQTLGEVAKVSGVYESAPADGSDQPNYLNAAVLLLTDLSAEYLCRVALPAIESRLGRIRDPANRYAARTIDLDLALYDEATLSIDHRTIPDPEIAERAFLAIPLAEVAGEQVVPPSQQTLADLAAAHQNSRALRHRPDVVLTRSNA